MSNTGRYCNNSRMYNVSRAGNE